MDWTAMLAAGHDCRDQGDEAGAAAWFRRALALDSVEAADPASAAEGWGALSECLAALGDIPDAVQAATQAARLEPERWRRWLALAELQAASDDTAAARASCRSALAHRPDAAPVYALLGRLLLAQGDTVAAAAALREAWALDGQDIDLAQRCAVALVAAGDPLRAVEMLEPLAQRHPGVSALAFHLGQAWAALGETAKAMAAWERCRRLDPSDAQGAGAAQASLTTVLPPDATFVQALFDRYAQHFDRDLLERLDYQAPALLHALARRHPVLARGNLAVLDLGCGTGLSGLPFRPLAHTLAGVDLSPRMLDQARRRQLYDRLTCGDLVATLNAAPAAWDLLLAADVLNYVGDLTPVFTAAARALRPGGVFLLTVEEAAATERTPVLTQTRRYRHPAGYIRATATQTGLAVSHLETASLRREKGAAVAGLVVSLAR